MYNNQSLKKISLSFFSFSAFHQKYDYFHKQQEELLSHIWANVLFIPTSHPHNSVEVTALADRSSSDHNTFGALDSWREQDV